MKKIILFVLLTIPLLIFAEYLPRNEAIKLLQSVKAEDHPNSDKVYISNNFIDLNEECLGTETSEFYEIVLTERGRQNNEISFYYDMNYSELEIEAIEVIKKDGNTISYDPQELLKKRDMNFGSFSNIYSYSTKILTGMIPDLQIGDIIYQKKIEKIIKSRMPNQYVTSFSIEGYSKYIHKFLKISLSSEIELFIHNLNDNGFSFESISKKENGKNIYEWTVKNNPLIIYEPDIENYNMFAHHLKITTIENWEMISRWYYELVEPHLKVDSEIQEKVKELTQSIEDKEKKAAKIFYWVAQKIRYLGVDKEKNRPGYEPHDVTFTFETRGGVCRDKAALLVAMLREAGINSDVILISAGSRLNPEAPVIWFNHAIVVVYDENGQPDLFFDPTDENTKDYLPKYEEDSSYIIASKEGRDLAVIPVSTPDKNNSSVNITLQLDENLNAQGIIKYSFNGLADTSIRNRFTGYTKQDFDNYFSKQTARFHPNAILKEYSYVDPQDKEKNINYEIEIEIPDYGRITDKNLFIPFAASRLDIHSLYENYVMSPFNLSERKYDFILNGAFSFDIIFDVSFAEKLKEISVPQLSMIDYQGFQTNFSSSFENNQLICDYHFETSNIHFKKEDFIPMKEKLAKLSKYNDLYIIGELTRRKK